MAARSGRAILPWFFAGMLAASLLWALPLWGLLDTAGEVEGINEAARTAASEATLDAWNALQRDDIAVALAHARAAAELTVVVPGMVDQRTGEALSITEAGLDELASSPHAGNLSEADSTRFVDGWGDALLVIGNLIRGEATGYFDTATFVVELERLAAAQAAALGSDG